MIIKIIGSAAGGGFPQWNCNGPQCQAVRRGDPAFTRRTQSSIAVSTNGRYWALFNASPDMREQIAATPELQPAADGAARHSPIKVVVVTNADVDHIAGLLTLREKEPFALYGSNPVLKTIAANPIFGALDADLVSRHVLPLGREIALKGPRGELGITVEAFAVPGKIPLYLEVPDQNPETFLSQSGDVIGLRIAAQDASSAFHYIPGCGWVDDRLRTRLDGSELLLFDGTLFTDTEMLDQGLGEKTGHRMGHLPLSGPDGAVAQLAGTAIARRVFIHMNNSNPILNDASEERAIVEEAGWEVSFDGMEITL